MANNFYNINIHKYNPANHPASGNISNENSDNANIEKLESTINQLNQPVSQPEPTVHTRLNNTDAKILVDEAYRNMDDEVFKYEYEINKLEAEIKSIDKEIEMAKSINDFQKADILTMRKHALAARLSELNNNYGKSDVSTKLSGGITSIINNKNLNILSGVFKACSEFVSEKILTKISKQYSSGQDIKTALYKLETLNKNVDELITMQTPYGEEEEHYDLLSEYLNTANVIHFHISKKIGTPTFFDTISSIDKDKYAKVQSKNKSNFGRMTGHPPVPENS